MKPTRTRYYAAVFLLALAAVIYLDRISISVLASEIARDLSLTKMQMSLVLSAALQYDSGLGVRRPGLAAHSGRNLRCDFAFGRLENAGTRYPARRPAGSRGRIGSQ